MMKKQKPVNKLIKTFPDLFLHPWYTCLWVGCVLILVSIASVLIFESHAYSIIKTAGWIAVIITLIVFVVWWFRSAQKQKPVKWWVFVLATIFIYAVYGWEVTIVYFLPVSLIVYLFNLYSVLHPESQDTF